MLKQVKSCYWLLTRAAFAFVVFVVVFNITFALLSCLHAGVSRRESVDRLHWNSQAILKTVVATFFLCKIFFRADNTWDKGLTLSCSSLFSRAFPLAQQPEGPRRLGGKDDKRGLTPFIMACEQSRAGGISERLLFELITQV